jgi:hypothetical protein
MGVGRILFRCALFALLSASMALAQPVKLAPVDEAAGDATWTRFRARLIDALLKRDHKFVDSLIERKVRNISGDDGIAEFRKLWELQKADSPLWSELPKVLFLGSVRVKREGSEEICAPYVYFKWPANAPDDANAAVIAREAIVQTRPSAGSPALSTAAYDLVHVTDWEVVDEDKNGKQIWVAVKTAAGTGYLPQEQVRSPLEYRACFIKRDGNWRLSGLEVGE